MTLALQNVVSQSRDYLIVDDSGLPVTGLLAATFPALIYSIAGPNADVAFPELSDLATITTAYSAGGVKERGNGRYRVDEPNGMYASLGKVTVRGEATGKHLLIPELQIVAFDPNNATNLGLINLDTTVSSRLAIAGNAQVTYVGPLNPLTGNATVIIGDDYKAADGRALDWINAAGNWPNLTAATVTFILGYGGQTTGKYSMSVITASGPNQDVRLELTAAQTALLAPTGANPLPFAIVATLSDTDSVTLVRGFLTILSRP